MNRNVCRVCDGSIKLMAYKATGICSERCRKVDEKRS